MVGYPRHEHAEGESMPEHEGGSRINEDGARLSRLPRAVVVVVVIVVLVEGGSVVKEVTNTSVLWVAVVDVVEIVVAVATL